MAIGWQTGTVSPSGPAGGDLAGTYPDPTVAGLQTRPVSAVAPVGGQVLKWDGAAWAPAADAAGVDYTATLWVDPNGDALSNGLAPAKPTTLDNALATVPAGGLIVLAAGTYTAGGPSFVAAMACTLDGQRSATLASALSITAANVRVVGMTLTSVADSSAAAGTTRLIDCVVSGAIAVSSPAASQTCEVTNSTVAAVSVTGVSGGSTLRLRACTGAVLTHSATGSVTVEVYTSTIEQIVCSGGGSLSTITHESRITASPSINVTSGTAVRTTMVGTICGVNSTSTGFGTLVLTGAPAASVRIHSSALARAASTIPVGAAVPVRSGSGVPVTVLGTVTTSNSPASSVLYARIPATGTLPLDPFTIYQSFTSFVVSGSSNNVAFWADTIIAGVPSAIGALEAPLGIANAQDTRTVTATFPGALFPNFYAELRFAKSDLSPAAGSITMKTATFVVEAAQ